MAETGIVAGLLAAPLLGEVTKEDADSAVVVDLARDILGDPYEDERASGETEGDVDRPTGEPGEPDEPGDPGAAAPSGRTDNA